MNILVTGAGGQLGKAVRNIADAYRHRCIFTDLTPDGEVLALDVTDPDAVGRFLDGHKVDVVVNCAAYTAVDKAEDDEHNAYRINAAAVGILADAVASRNLTLIHISTDYVFDGQANSPYREDDVPSPLNAYGRTKLEGERLILASGCRHIIVRTAWLYSCNGRNFYNTVVEKTAESSHMNVVVDQVGCPTYASDLAQALFHIIEKGTEGKEGIYHYTGQGVCSWYDFAVAIRDAVGHICRIDPCRSSDYPAKAKRPVYSVLDCSRIKKVFGLDIPHWTESVRMCTMDYERMAL